MCSDDNKTTDSPVFLRCKGGSREKIRVSPPPLKEAGVAENWAGAQQKFLHYFYHFMLKGRVHDFDFGFFEFFFHSIG